MLDNMYQNVISNKLFSFFVCFLAALAGLLFGLDIGVIAGALPFITTEFHVTIHQQEWIVSSMMLGAAIGAISNGWMSKFLGRKNSLIAGALLFVSGSIFCAQSTTPQMLIVSRLIVGLAVGIASYTTPLYLSEIASENIRGSMISLYQLMITIGILVAYISDTAFSVNGNWRYMLGIITIPALILLISVCFLPKSPRWLAAKGYFDDAKRILDRLRESTDQAKNELTEIRESLKLKQSGWMLFKSNCNFRRAVLLGMLLQIMQQFTGMNIIMYYSPKLFEIAGFATVTQKMIGTIIVGVVNVFATFIAIGVVDRLGRRPLLMLGFLIMSIAMFALATILHIGVHTTLDKYLAVAMLLIFIGGFGMSAGPLIWVLCSEIQPLKGRDFGLTVSTSTNWIANLVVGGSFLTLLNKLGNANTFWLYSILNLIFVLLTLLLIPETSNISLEHIERNLMSGNKLRDIGSRK
ncbi:sugar porter family MFS transporter [Candidatus Ishikawella capsulata]|nr:sugar porter family MFS transporter [Candidatus Ishikawaella capsulata]